MEHHHHHHSEECCGSSQGCAPHECADKSCCHEHHKEGECDFAEILLDLADEAWMDLLREKIMKEIEASCGQKLNQLAKMVAETNNARWHAKIAKKKACADFRQNIKKFFEADCSKGECK